MEKETLRAGFWNEQDKARGTLQEQSRLNEAVAKWKRQKQSLEDLALLCEIASEEEDGHAQEEIRNELDNLSASVRDDELKMMLGSEQDSMNAIMSIHAGAGGVLRSHHGTGNLHSFGRRLPSQPADRGRNPLPGRLDAEPGDVAGSGHRYRYAGG